MSLGFCERFDIKRDFKKDIDIVAVGSGIELALKVSALLQKTKSSGFQNLWYSYVAFEDTEIEFVGARKESIILTAEIRL
jgi:tRNA nucleotidyltransferase (CCA-adding enzyme)